MPAGLAQPHDMIWNSQNETPWHRLGVRIDGLATAADVDAACPRLTDPVLKVSAELDGQPVPGHYFTIRQDDRTVLGHVGTEYTILQNSEMLTLAERLCQDPHGPLFETAGLLWNGRKSWVLCKLPEFMILRGRNGAEDIVNQYLLISNAHDGSQRVRIGATPIRVVCQNTLNLAQRTGSRNTAATIVHSGDVSAKAINAGKVIGLAVRQFEETQELYQALLSREVTAAETDTFLQTIIPDTVSQRATLQRERVLQAAETGIGIGPGLRGTAWALYQGATEVSDHINGAGSKRPDADDMRANAIMFGSGLAWKQQALHAAAALLN